MEKSLALELVKQQLEYDQAHGKPFVSTAEAVENLTIPFLDLRHEVFKNERDMSLERMTQEAVEVAAMSLRFIIDLM